MDNLQQWNGFNYSSNGCTIIGAEGQAEDMILLDKMYMAAKLLPTGWPISNQSINQIQKKEMVEWKEKYFLHDRKLLQFSVKNEFSN